MTSFPILDLVAGIVFVYFLLSIISSTAVEMIMTGSKLRAAALEKWLKDIFNEKVNMPGGGQKLLGTAIMDHCAVTALSDSGKSTSYIAAPNFVSALLEKITFNTDPNRIATDIADYIEVLEKTRTLSTELQRTFLVFAHEANNAATIAMTAVNITHTATADALNAVELFKGKIETWFNSNMDRVGGYLKTKYTRPLTFLISAVTALALNADSVAIAKYLYNNPDARAKVAASAYAAAGSNNTQQKIDSVQKALAADPKNDKNTAPLQEITDSLKAELKQINTAKAALEETTIPLGWSAMEYKGKEGWALILAILSKFVGLFATFLAVTMGAPFWFDILNKVSNLRGTGAKPKETKSKTPKK
jgi:hypothetical protein